MMAVFDGHGVEGHTCARWAKHNVPRIMAKLIRQARVRKYQGYLKEKGIRGAKTYDPPRWPFLNEEEYKTCCKKAFVQSNQTMHKDSQVRFSLFVVSAGQRESYSPFR